MNNVPKEQYMELLIDKLELELMYYNMKIKEISNQLVNVRRNYEEYMRGKNEAPDSN